MEAIGATCVNYYTERVRFQALRQKENKNEMMSMRTRVKRRKGEERGADIAVFFPRAF